MWKEFAVKLLIEAVLKVLSKIQADGTSFQVAEGQEDPVSGAIKHLETIRDTIPAE